MPITPVTQNPTPTTAAQSPAAKISAIPANSRGLNTRPLKTPTGSPLLHELDTENSTGQGGKKFLVMIAIFVITAGLGTGYLLAGAPRASGSQSDQGLGATKNNGGLASVISGGLEEGIDDADHFPDLTEGELQANDGSVTQEGTHILIRPGGISQTVYLTSSVVDMDKYIGKQVQIRGQTQTSQKAGWLMEVGWIKTL